MAQSLNGAAGLEAGISADAVQAESAATSPRRVEGLAFMSARDRRHVATSPPHAANGDGPVPSGEAASSAVAAATGLDVTTWLNCEQRRRLMAHGDTQLVHIDRWQRVMCGQSVELAALRQRSADWQDALGRAMTLISEMERTVARIHDMESLMSPRGLHPPRALCGYVLVFAAL